MQTELKEFRCPKCPTLSRGALLFRAEGEAVVEIKCPRCKNVVVINFDTMDFEEAKEMVKAND